MSKPLNRSERTTTKISNGESAHVVIQRKGKNAKRIMRILARRSSITREKETEVPLRQSIELLSKSSQLAINLAKQKRLFAFVFSRQIKCLPAYISSYSEKFILLRVRLLLLCMFFIYKVHCKKIFTI